MWKTDTDGNTIIPTMGWGNCGGRCIIRAHVKDGVIQKISTQTKAEGEAQGRVPLTACMKGMNYHKTFLNDQRLRYPMKRVGERGSGDFVRISWEEALDTIAREWVRIRDTYGVGSRYVHYATGVCGLVSGRDMVKRLLSLDGGYLDYYNSYSSACINYVTPYLYGRGGTGNSLDSLLSSQLILLWGHNPAETKFDADSMYYLHKAKEQGIPILSIDPRRSDTILALDAKWMPIKPTTDAALADAMAYVIYTEGLCDKAFLDEHCLGFDRQHMPEGIDPNLSYLPYLLGEIDGTPKTPDWGSAITGMPAEDISWLARTYATAKPAALIPGYGLQRHDNGEQGIRGQILLACMTGNVGVLGGWAGGPPCSDQYPMPQIHRPPNPYPGKIPVFLWGEAVERGTEMTQLDGLEGVEKLDTNVKMIFNLGGNALVNQHGDINRALDLLRDTSKCEFIVGSDLFMTSSAKCADILLPGTSLLETENISTPWQNGDFIGYVNQVVEPVDESRFEYDWLVELSERLGLKEAFTEGHETVKDWLKFAYEALKAQEPYLPDFEDFRQAGIYRYPLRSPLVNFADNIFPTKSGKVELFSEEIYHKTYREHVPAIPMYVPATEGVSDPLTQNYPLQLIGYHTKRRTHSIHDNNLALHKADPQALWIHPKDAQARGIVNGDVVQVYNSRGQVEIQAKVTEKIMEGVVALAQGAWYQADQSGTDVAGSINVLTSQKPTPLAKGNGQHTNLVEVALSTSSKMTKETKRI